MLTRGILLSLCLVIPTLVTAPSEARAEETSPAKPKATKASVTATKVKLERARDDIRALAKLAAPAGLTAEQRKIFDAEIAKLEPLADGTDKVTKSIDAGLKEARAKLDSLSEMGEMESMRLQKAMERMAAMMATLSNITKKHSDTASQIVQNMK